MLVTRTENMTKKVMFVIFREKLGKYILREFNNASDVVCVVRYMSDPINSFGNKRKPKSMSANDLRDTINAEIQQRVVKSYVNR